MHFHFLSLCGFQHLEAPKHAQEQKHGSGRYKTCTGTKQIGKMEISERTFHLTWRSPSGFPFLSIFLSLSRFWDLHFHFLSLCVFQHLEAPKHAQEQKHGSGRYKTCTGTKQIGKMEISERTFHLTWRSPSGFPFLSIFLSLPRFWDLHFHFCCPCAGFGAQG